MSCTVVASDARPPLDAEPVVDIDRWARLAEAAVAHEGGVGELALTFVNRDDIAALNHRYMDESGPTDVLSFPMDDDPQHGVPTLLGDIVVCPAVAGEQFLTHAGTLDDELALLVVHGVLHVLGHDHAEPDETETMRARELDLLERYHWGGSAPEGFRHIQD
jgi:probable rRNA maturation factor